MTSETDAVEHERIVDFNPLRNAADYLDSVFEHLTDKPSQPGARALKYAILHLQAATEILLKARLIHEHWSLVYRDPKKANLSQFRAGAFDSCSVEAAMDRLAKIAEVPIEQKDREAIASLAKTRNALTHYGHTASAFALESQAAKVLSFLLAFVTKQLVPRLGDDDSWMARKVDDYWLQLADLQAVVEERMKGLSGQLQQHAEYTVWCPDCRQPAFIPGETPTCLFCLQEFDDPENATLDWGYGILGDPDYGPDWFVDNCHCGVENTLVFPVTTVGIGPGEDVALCFACRAVYREEKKR
ncbi:hypothetical protein [Streptomyces sulphureus]|uniref:hypothetical protein n=1 Tax=Streptomyces sulphureus TaxID=47758 RepID=UPI0003A57CC8|nr:hypothetical protein [Streptomyces sulphureus]